MSGIRFGARIGNHHRQAWSEGGLYRAAQAESAADVSCQISTIDQLRNTHGITREIPVHVLIERRVHCMKHGRSPACRMSKRWILA